MRQFLAAALVLGFVGGFGIAEEKKADPTGTWKWTVKRGDQSFDMTVKLKKEGDKLTGAIVGREGKEIPIEDASCKGGEVCFKVTREGRNGQKMTTTYKGKLKGDTITGKSEREGGQPRDWEAKRSKD